ncbi:MAG: glutamate racemase [Alistipes sp.]|nr:glutamate racemase [Alistipes sp.]
MNNGAIGVYDSGFGGLSVWRELHDSLPAESLIYLGDGKNCPYGGRSKEQIAEFAEAAVGRLLSEGCKMIVVACNTATAAAIDKLRGRWTDTPIVGLEPAIKPACERSKTRCVGVLATAHSLAGDMFHRTAERYAADVEVVAAVGEGFVEIVEQGMESTPEAEQAVRRVVEPMLARGVDTIVLGCTHYPFLRRQIECVVGDRRVEIIDSGKAVARRVADLLDRLSLRADGGHMPQYRFLSFADEEYRMRLESKAFDRAGY